jgi:hypothetical protein
MEGVAAEAKDHHKKCVSFTSTNIYTRDHGSKDLAPHSPPFRLLFGHTARARTHQVHIVPVHITLYS